MASVEIASVDWVTGENPSLQCVLLYVSVQTKLLLQCLSSYVDKNDEHNNGTDWTNLSC